MQKTPIGFEDFANPQKTSYLRMVFEDLEIPHFRSKDFSEEPGILSF
jgi:hypothetical protein